MELTSVIILDEEDTISEELKSDIPWGTLFDDFHQYSQNAIRFGSAEYDFKPVYKSHFFVIKKKLHDKIYNEKKQNLQYEQINSISKFGEFLLRDQTILEFMASEVHNSEKFAKKLLYLGLDTQLYFPAVALLEITAHRARTSEPASKINTYSIYEVRNFLEETSQQDYIAFVNDKNTIGLLFSWNNLKIIDELSKKVSSMFDISFTIGIGRPYKSLTDVFKSYYEAAEALNGKFYKGKGCTIYYKDVRSFQKTCIYPQEIETHLLECMKTSSPEMIKNVIHDFFNDLLKFGKVEPKFVYDSIIRLLIGIEKNFIKETNWKYDLNNSNLISLNDVTNLETLSESIEFIFKYLMNIFKYLYNTNLETNSILIKKAFSYMEQDCQFATLNSIAEKVYVTPSYLSLLFKMETGENFIDLLTRIRIEKAKNLLKNTQLKNYEIAQKVGYQNQRYFSQIFKKIVGVSPREFRKKVI